MTRCRDEQRRCSARSPSTLADSILLRSTDVRGAHGRLEFSGPNLLVDHTQEPGAQSYELCESPPRTGNTLFPLDASPYSLTGGDSHSNLGTGAAESVGVGSVKRQQLFKQLVGGSQS